MGFLQSIRVLSIKFVKFIRGITMFDFGVAMLILSTLSLAGLAFLSHQHENDFIGDTDMCLIDFFDAPRDSRKVYQKETNLYECPQTGLQLVDYNLNVIFLQQQDVIKKYALRCYYRVYASRLWIEIHYLVILQTEMVEVRCLHDSQIVFADCFPLVPVPIENEFYIQLLENNSLLYRNASSNRMKRLDQLKKLKVLVIMIRGFTKSMFVQHLRRTRKALVSRLEEELFPYTISVSKDASVSFMALLRNNHFDSEEYLFKPFLDDGYYTASFDDRFDSLFTENDLSGVTYNWNKNKKMEEYGTKWFEGQLLCVQNRRYHEMIFNQVVGIARAKKRLLAWVTLNLVRRSDTHLASLDKLLSIFLKQLETFKLLDDVIILVASDQGREHGVLDDVQSAYDERYHPIASIYLSKLMKQSQPQFMQLIEEHQNNLITHHFLYSLILSLLPSYKEDCRTALELIALKPFEVPGRFHCPFEIPEEMCPCHRTKVTDTSIYIERSVDYVLTKINKRLMMPQESAHCGRLTRGRIVAAEYFEKPTIFKIQFVIYVNEMYRPDELFEAYVQTKYFLPIDFKLLRLTYTKQAMKKPCLKSVPSSLKLYCFC